MAEFRLTPLPNGCYQTDIVEPGTTKGSIIKATFVRKWFGNDRVKMGSKAYQEYTTKNLSGSLIKLYLKGRSKGWVHLIPVPRRRVVLDRNIGSEAVIICEKAIYPVCQPDYNALKIRALHHQGCVAP